MSTTTQSFERRPPPARAGWWRFVGRHLPSLSVMLMASMLVATLLFPYVVITVPSGSVGVLWKRFNGYDLYCWCFVGRGTILDPKELRDEGLHLVWPWDKLFIYDLRLQSTTQTYNAITKDGVSVVVQINIRFQLLHNSIGVLHKFIGPQYLNSVVAPEIGSQAREVISQYSAEEVYRSREAIQKAIRNKSQASLGAHLNSLVQPEAMEQPDPKHYNDFLQNSIQILDTLVLSIELPPAIVAAINRQTEQFYQIQEYKYRVEREVEEAKRKQVEANGIAAFQRTVSKGISDSYLRWRGIEATLALAQSKNSKIVIIGSGKEGLPIILGNMDNNTNAPAAPGPVPAPVSNTPAPTPETAPQAPEAVPAPGGAVAPPASGANEHGEKNASAAAAAAASKPPERTQAAGPPPSSIAIDLSEIKSLLSRITDRLHPNAPAKTSGPEQPKK
jgi:regulator of protease activity HflC (stomatin/prohibitin superfamily)